MSHAFLYYTVFVLFGYVNKQRRYIFFSLVQLEFKTTSFNFIRVPGVDLYVPT
jgi:hypothetical protein